ncbi:MAG: ribonuclease H-like domain-containing protein [Thermomicrobiales bacterium]|nr:ribonuclease H-like domain-containing protein [Thermomicrobiales bacterium]MCO5228089.1 ribonuclease H-like domain-containing protein [Thermomicrobiales bacterium]
MCWDRLSLQLPAGCVRTRETVPIERSLSDQPNFALASREHFSAEDASILLYGADARQGVVAIEPAGPYEVEIFFAEGWKKRWSERHVTRPWAIIRNPSIWAMRDDIEITPLRGNLPFRSLLSFQTWNGWRQAGMSEARRRGDALCPPTLPMQYQIRTGTTLFKGMTFDQVRRLQLDIETTTLDPHAPDASIFMIALKQGSLEQVLVRTGTEEKLLEELNTVIQKLDPDVIEGHNIYSFDIPYITARALKLGVKLAWGRNKTEPYIREEGRQTVAYVHGRHVIDTLVQVQRFDIAGNLTRYGLKDVIDQLGLTREDREFIPGDAIRSAWEQRDIDRLTRYALDDVRDVDVLSRVIMPNEFYQTQMVPMGYQQCALAGTGRKIDELMQRAYVCALHSLPMPFHSEPFPGGYVEVLHSGVFKPVVKCDVESLYPSIMIREGIRSRNDVLEAFPVLLKYLRTRRIDAKRRSQNPDDPNHAMWDGLQGGFKILINSFFGYLGFGRGQFNDFDAARRITLEGQRLIQQIVGELEQAGAQPIEVDTDGVYFVPPHDISGIDQEHAFIDRIGATLPEGITLAHDGSYTAMLSLRQKMYALLTPSGKVKLTGSALRSRALEPCFRTLIHDVSLALMQDDLDAAKDHYFALAERIRDQSLPISQFAQTIRPRERTVGSRPKLKEMLEANPGKWSFGERISIYEQQGGGLAFADDYANDLNTAVMLNRLKDVIERFRVAIGNDPVFDATFPAITPTTDLDVARTREPIQQLGLF